NWLAKIVGRALAKFAWLAVCAMRYKPDIFIGYHIFPGALTALIVARLFDRPTCYQMTGGPAEVLGGGVSADNPLMSRLRRPSPLLDFLAMSVVRQFVLVVVRGSKAQVFLLERGLDKPVAIITGSVAFDPRYKEGVRRYDLAFVGNLIERKQPLQFVEIVA